MPLAHFIGTLLTKAGSLQQLRAILRDHRDEIFVQIGDQEVRAALRALSDAAISTEPDRERQVALGMLRTAQERFNDVAAEPPFWLGLVEALGNGFTAGLSEFGSKRRDAAERAVETSLLLAVFYQTVGQPLIAAQFTRDSRSAFKRFSELEMRFTRERLARTGVRGWRAIEGKEEIEEFEKALEATGSKLEVLCKKIECAS